MLLLGDAAVGKTALKYVMAALPFPSNYQSTIGLEFTKVSVYSEDEGREETMAVWDSSSSPERFRNGSAASLYARFPLFLLCYCDQRSFWGLKRWYLNLSSHCSHAPIIVICQTKIDLSGDELTAASSTLLSSSPSSFPSSSSSASASLTSSETTMMTTTELTRIGAEYAEEIGAHFIATSAKTNSGVQELTVKTYSLLHQREVDRLLALQRGHRSS